MKRILTIAGLIVMTCLISGCYTTGLSLREVGRFNYSNFIYGLYGDQTVSKKETSMLRKPIKLAVAQVGENAPPRIMLDKLKNEKSMISLLETIPVGGMERGYYGSDQKEIDKNDFQQQMVKMRQLTKDLGADYLFIFGGSADYGYAPNLLQVFDITIVGAYVLPSVKHMAEGRASGALIDVNDGRVIFVVDAESKLTKHTPSYLNYYEGNDQILVQLRNDLVSNLSDKFIDKLENKIN
jgi:hypothetical protein